MAGLQIRLSPSEQVNRVLRPATPHREMKTRLVDTIRNSANAFTVEASFRPALVASVCVATVGDTLAANFAALKSDQCPMAAAAINWWTIQ